MRDSIFKTSCIAVIVSTGLIPVASAQDKFDRTVLPIQEPARPTYSELDVRNVKKMPPLFKVTAPEKAPRLELIGKH